MKRFIPHGCSGGDWKEFKGVPSSSYDALAAENERLREDAERYYRIMDALRDADRFKGKHGKCKPREDRACSACNAADVIAEMLAAYKGRRIMLADAARGADSAELAMPEVTK